MGWQKRKRSLPVLPSPQRRLENLTDRELTAADRFAHEAVKPLLGP